MSGLGPSSLLLFTGMGPGGPHALAMEAMITDFRHTAISLKSRHQTIKCHHILRLQSTTKTKTCLWFYSPVCAHVPLATVCGEREERKSTRERAGHDHDLKATAAEPQGHQDQGEHTLHRSQRCVARRTGGGSRASPPRVAGQGRGRSLSSAASVVRLLFRDSGRKPFAHSPAQKEGHPKEHSPRE